MYLLIPLNWGEIYPKSMCHFLKLPRYKTYEKVSDHIFKTKDEIKSVNTTQQLRCGADISITSLPQVAAASPHFKLKSI